MTFRLQRPHPPSSRTKTPKQRQQPKQPPTLTLTQKLTHLSTPLHPLLNVTTGLPHPSFPRTLLHYHLLTHAQLDNLASYYHQRTPGPFTGSYPYMKGLGWRRHGMGLEEKRRKFGRFCGLRGCESPGLPSPLSTPLSPLSREGASGNGEMEMEMEMDGEEEEEEEEVMMVIDGDADMEREREVRERMEREWRSAVRRGREEEEWREKVGGRRFW